MAGGEYRIEPAEVRSITSTVRELGSTAMETTRDLDRLVLDGLAFAQIGGSVAGANASMQQQLVSGFSRFVNLIEDLTEKLKSAVDGYDDADRATAQGYGGGNGEVQQAQAQGGGAAAGGNADQLDPRVVESIMRSEGASGEQGGRQEAYGFREGNGTAYREIMAARREFGQGSAEEIAVVTRHMSDSARQAGALNFTDAGVQAAIMSGAHMRGVGGVQAILNSMAGADIARSGTLTPETIQHIQGLSSEEFQQQFRDTRLEYDREIYGDTTTRQGGQVQNWWDRYGNGLTQRYEREQQEFLGLARE
ncbi:WXG100 family type VII secretion target [Amycolatopsis magusensis]|uniref:hypothetical protein n=1 Tax=Amycolatopsis magusensis TaxID=882444 RepID=UPI0024A86B40|nr:hypothetical protein [Amycolatopsis magusensis]MDI5978513.1 hypothetical protein [Amycolatopsis magusensis]